MTTKLPLIIQTHFSCLLDSITFCVFYELNDTANLHERHSKYKRKNADEVVSLDRS